MKGIYEKVHRETYEERKYSREASVAPHTPKATDEMRYWDAELIDGKLIEDTKLLSINGWLNEHGDLLSCGWLQHDKTVKALGYRNERDAVKAGYIRLSMMTWQIEKQICGTAKVSDSQLKTIKKWHLRNELNLDYFNYYNQDYALEK